MGGRINAKIHPGRPRHRAGRAVLLDARNVEFGQTERCADGRAGSSGYLAIIGQVLRVLNACAFGLLPRPFVALAWTWHFFSSAGVSSTAVFALTFARSGLVDCPFFFSGASRCPMRERAMALAQLRPISPPFRFPAFVWPTCPVSSVCPSGRLRFPTLMASSYTDALFIVAHWVGSSWALVDLAICALIQHPPRRNAPAKRADAQCGPVPRTDRAGQAGVPALASKVSVQKAGGCLPSVSLGTLWDLLVYQSGPLTQPRGDHNQWRPLCSREKSDQLILASTRNGQRLVADLAEQCLLPFLGGLQHTASSACFDTPVPRLWR